MYLQSLKRERDKVEIENLEVVEAETMKVLREVEGAMDWKEEMTKVLREIE